VIDTAALLQQTDIVALIGGTVKLRRFGAGRHVGLCPFHNEKTGSFLVYGPTAGDPGHYHCHGCGAHGDAIRWLCDHDRMTFKDACAELTQLAGLDRAPAGTAKPKPPKEPPQPPLQGPMRPDLTATTPAVIVPHKREIGAALALFPSSQVYAGTAESYLRPLQGRDTLIWCGARMDRSLPEYRAIYGWARNLARAAVMAKRVRIGFGWHPTGLVMFEPATGRAWPAMLTVARPDRTVPAAPAVTNAPAKEVSTVPASLSRGVSSDVAA
jgi:hypothetical protein